MENNSRTKKRLMKELAELRQRGAQLQAEETMRNPKAPYSGLRDREAERAMKWYRETRGYCPKCTAAGFYGRLIFDESGPVCINCAWRPRPDEPLSLID